MGSSLLESLAATHFAQCISRPRRDQPS